MGREKEPMFPVEDLSSEHGANVTPPFKKGERYRKGNYGPVRLTSVFGKMLVSIIENEVLGYLEAHDKIGHSQHGFLKGKIFPDNSVGIL